MSLIKNIYIHKNTFNYTATVVVDFVDGTQAKATVVSEALMQEHAKYFIKDTIQEIVYLKVEEDVVEMLKKTPVLPQIEEFVVNKATITKDEIGSLVSKYKVFQDLYPETKHWLNKHMEDLKTKPKPEDHFKAQPFNPLTKPKPFNPLTKPKLTPQLSSATVLGALGAVCPDLLSVIVKCPYCKDTVAEHTNKIAEIIMHLNDNTPWTREQIADWLETLDADLNLLKEEK